MKEFFDKLRDEFGPLTQAQVDGINLIMEEMKGLPLNHQAYILATVWHETDRTMQPIEEYGKGRRKIYGKRDPATGKAYYGRGYVQLTWKENYQKAQVRLRELKIIPDNISFVLNPELVMQPTYAAKILVIGMKEGWFTSKKLSDFTDFKSMRRIVNGTDKDDEIAEYAEKFKRALIVPVPAPPPKVTLPPPPIEKSEEVERGIIAWIFGGAIALAAAVAAWFMNGGN